MDSNERATIVCGDGDPGQTFYDEATLTRTNGSRNPVNGLGLCATQQSAVTTMTIGSVLKSIARVCQMLTTLGFAHPEERSEVPR
jgi:hypothetical protein